METQEKTPSMIFLDTFIKKHRTFTVFSIQEFMRKYLSWQDVKSLDDLLSREIKFNTYQLVDDLALNMLEFSDVDVYERYESAIEKHCKMRMLQIVVIAVRSRESAISHYESSSFEKARHIINNIKKMLEQFDDLASRIMRDDIHTNIFEFMES